jgi:hypothetical protein
MRTRWLCLIWKYSKPSIIRLQLIRIEIRRIKKFCSQLRKADESLVCSNKLDSFFKLPLLRAKTSTNFWAFYRWINVFSLCSFYIKVLHDISLLIFISITSIITFSIYFVVSFFLSFRVTFWFTTPDFRLIQMTSPPINPDYQEFTVLYFRKIWVSHSGVYEGFCLLTCNVYSSSTIPAFRRHVTILKQLVYVASEVKWSEAHCGEDVMDT